MVQPRDDLEIVEFASVDELREWLAVTSPTHPGVWVRLARAHSTRPSVSFHELLVEGIAYGWSESTRRSFDGESYLQKFSPRRLPGTRSPRNTRIAAELEKEGRLTEAGRRALGL